ncbi:hypothetical protein GF373_01965 [bacterium]|nr:hypothetical protein [bacterium]
MMGHLFQANKQLLEKRWPALGRGLPAMAETVELTKRSDGFFQARCVGDRGEYTLSHQADLAHSLYAFRGEMRKGLLSGADLFFLLGMGLGEKWRGAWETLEHYQDGFLVVLEESMDVVSAACRATDLRAVFSSPRVELIVSKPLEEEVRHAIRERSWFGAKKSLFYWGYDVKNPASQPAYDDLAQNLRQFIAAEQDFFLGQWKSWIERKRQPFSQPSRRTVIKVHCGFHSQLQADLIKPFSDTENTVISLSSQTYISPTYLMQQFILHDPDELVWVNEDNPGRWFPPNVFSSLPLSSVFIRESSDLG